MDIITRAENAIKGIMVKDKFNNNVLLLRTGHIRKFLTSVNLVRAAVSGGARQKHRRRFRG